MFKISIKSLLLIAIFAIFNSQNVLAQHACSMGTNDVPSAARKSLVITSKDIDFTRVDFSLERTLGQIVKTSDKSKETGIENSVDERRALLQSMLRSLRRGTYINSEANVTVKVDRRPEGSIPTSELLDQTLDNGLPKGMHPVALFNRFDLSPVNFQNCGEHRIVYMLGDGSPITHRMTLIFEARVENPSPEKGHLGCLPIAQFWKNLESKSAGQIAEALEAFFYDGLIETSDDPITPVVHFKNYGFHLGQVRGNLFVLKGEDFKWQLREWHTDLNPDGSPYFRAETVKDTPIENLWTDIPVSDEFAALQKEFKRDLLTANLERLLLPERQQNQGDEADFIALIGAEFSSKFSDFQSISQGQTEVPGLIISPSMKNEITARLNSSQVSPKPDIEEILNRAGAVTCGGCHQFSNGVKVGGAPGAEINWPESSGFVHTEENGNLSDALMTTFLVSRCRNLNAYLDNVSAFAPPSAIVSLPPISDLSGNIATIQSEKNLSLRLEGLSQLKTKTDILRQAEERLPGAFVPVRRVH